MSLKLIVVFFLFFLLLYICNDNVNINQVKVEGSVHNKGWVLENVDYKDTSVPEEIRIRGFKINKIEQLEKNYSEPGKFSLKP